MNRFFFSRGRRRIRSYGSLFVASATLFGAALLLPASTADARGAQFLGSVAGSSQTFDIVAIAPTPSGGGYWLLNERGFVFDFGDATNYGGMGSKTITAPVVDLVPTPTGRGYWLIGRDGGVYHFGDAPFRGSMRAKGISAPIVGGASTPTGRGYWLFGRDGGVYNLGDAAWRGSMRAKGTSAPVVGGTATKSGNGYWMTSRDGGVYNLGDAPYYGSMRGKHPKGLIIDIARTPSGKGYWLVSTAGSIYHFGDAKWRGSVGGNLMLSPVASLAANARGGYWFLSRDGAVYTASAEGYFTADPNALSTRLQRMQVDLFIRVNQEREARGLRPLEWDPQLTKLAMSWSNHMGATGSFAHQDFSAIFRNPDYASRYRSLRENIYNGTGDWRSAGAAHVALMNSDPHRKTILTPELTSMGIGVACLGGRLWVTEEFGVWLSNPAPVSRSTPPRDPIVRDQLDGASC